MSSSINAKSFAGDIIVAFGYATRESVESALAWQASERQAGREPGFIGEILVGQDVCSPEQRDFAIEVQSKLRSTFDKTQELIPLDEKSLIGKILVALGFANQTQVEEAFVWQKSERDAGRDPGMIGKILVNRGVCTADDVDYGMKVQNLLRGVK